jgi:proline dehydrogenase
MSLIDKAVSLSLPIVPKPIVGFFSKRYIAGSSTDDAFRVVRELEREGAMATLDILGEFISSLEQADANTRAYVDLVRRLATEKFREANVSVKLTALGLLLDETRCRGNLRALVGAAAECGGFVRIDMEDA